MRLHRFIGNFDLSKKSAEITDKAVINQIKNVFRLKPGSELMIANGEKREALAMITAISKAAISLDIVDVQENEKEPEIYGILYCAILKKENFELVAQKAVEAGISEIIPMLTTRTVKTALNIPRLEKIIKEAAEQANRGIVPKICPPIAFEDALRQTKNNDTNLFFRPSGLPMRETKIAGPRVGVFIGPEGGWDDKETELAEKYQLNMATLGKLILRSETAAIIASYLVIQ